MDRPISLTDLFPSHPQLAGLHTPHATTLGAAMVYVFESWRDWLLPICGIDPRSPFGYGHMDALEEWRTYHGDMPWGSNGHRFQLCEDWFDGAARAIIDDSPADNAIARSAYALHLVNAADAGRGLMTPDQFATQARGYISSMPQMLGWAAPRS